MGVKNNVGFRVRVARRIRHPDGHVVENGPEVGKNRYKGGEIVEESAVPFRALKRFPWLK
eukprot:4886654-Prymnesium_polylepis.3